MSASVRKQQIDVLRGIVMVIMLLDHARDFFHNSQVNPLDPAQTTPLLYFTRWITHFCAPVFVFLSGVSAWFQLGRHKSRGTGRFLMSRGLWLILMEWTVIAFAWTFDPGFHFIPFQVIWAIGICMVLLGLLIRTGLRAPWIFFIGLVIIFGHNALDKLESDPSFRTNFLWDLLHGGHFSIYHFLPGHSLAVVYPFLPWLGIMMCGFGLGPLFSTQYDSSARQKLLMGLSTLCLSIFVALRASELYGDPQQWHGQGSFSRTLMSFLDVCKYPPSLLYTCMTLGPAFLLLAMLENADNFFTRIMTVYGRTAFFFYILHLYAIHLVALILYLYHGHHISEAQNFVKGAPFLYVVQGEGFGLGGVYLLWLLITVALFPLCYWYDKYKRAHPEKVWLRYI